MEKKKLSKEELSRKKQLRLNEAEKLGIVGMIEAGIPLKEISRQTGRSVQTIWKLKENARYPATQVESIKKGLSRKIWERCDKAEDLLTEKMDSMSGYQLAGVIHLGVQDGRLLDGETTANIGVAGRINHLISDPEALREIMVQARALRRQEVIGGQND